jgi:hypothetical protein
MHDDANYNRFSFFCQRVGVRSHGQASSSLFPTKRRTGEKKFRRAPCPSPFFFRLGFSFFPFSIPRAIFPFFGCKQLVCLSPTFPSLTNKTRRCVASSCIRCKEIELMEGAYRVCELKKSRSSRPFVMPVHRSTLTHAFNRISIYHASCLSYS